MCDDRNGWYVTSLLEKKVALRVVPTTAETNEVCWVDSDRTDDAGTRRSVSGGFMTQKEVPVGSWARTQATHSLSSCEAELYAIGSGCAESLGLAKLGGDGGEDIGEYPH